ncbi:MAG: bifunctional enoyl-CoA hydratase/phosphate acetyltransferase [Desulfuromonadales bacterium]|nr:bifunctional enoyl-CoA hydratase/phosphate acetyltransferase [Desulfuromonadales bacterium]
MIRNFADLRTRVKEKPARTIAVVCPEGEEVIKLIARALESRIAEFILLGDPEAIRALAAGQLDLGRVELIATKEPRAAAEEAVRLVVAGRAQALMKGNLPTATFLKAILDKQQGLHASRLISEVTLLEKGGEEGLQLLTDCAINIAPTLEEKVQIIENAVALARRLGYHRPRVAVLSAVELVNPALPDTIDAAVLSKMADRGQIKDAVVDGPFALDNALSREAAQYKKIGGEVAGQADILLAPNLQVGNALHKALVFWAHRPIATAVLGARAPIIMTSRSDSMQTMLDTVALAAYIS